MFIAVINENFDVAEESKRSRQASHFWAAHRPEKARAAWVRRLNPYRWFKAKPKAIAVDQLPSSLVLPMQKTLVQDHHFPTNDVQVPTVRDIITSRTWNSYFTSVESWWQEEGSSTLPFQIAQFVAELVQWRNEG